MHRVRSSGGHALQDCGPTICHRHARSSILCYPVFNYKICNLLLLAPFEIRNFIVLDNLRFCENPQMIFDHV